MDNHGVIWFSRNFILQVLLHNCEEKLNREQITGQGQQPFPFQFNNQLGTIFILCKDIGVVQKMAIFPYFM